MRYVSRACARVAMVWIAWWTNFGIDLQSAARTLEQRRIGPHPTHRGRAPWSEFRILRTGASMLTPEGGFSITHCNFTPLLTLLTYLIGQQFRVIDVIETVANTVYVCGLRALAIRIGGQYHT